MVNTKQREIAEKTTTRRLRVYYLYTVSRVNACVQLYLILMLLGFVTVVYRLLIFFCACVWMITLQCQINCNL